MTISRYTRFIYEKNGGAFRIRKDRFHQAEEPRSPNLRKGDQAFVFVCISIKERSWLRLIKRAGSKGYFFL